MAGLIEKDIRILGKRSKFFVVALLCGLVLGFNDSSTFVVGYLTLLSIIVAVSTISYDEFDNGYAYLMTLPVIPKDYVREKFLLGGMVSGASWLVATVLAFVINALKGGLEAQGTFAFLIEAAMLFPIAIFVLSIMIPVQIKFGSEKSRVVTIVLFGGISAVCMLGIKVLESLGIDISGMVNQMPQISEGVVLLGALVFAAVIAIISMNCTQKIMEKKEY